MNRNNKLLPRAFFPGTEWIYIKLYTSPEMVDKLLSKDILYLQKYLTTKNKVDLFFFIRYNDPESHIRLRMHVVDIKFIAEIIYMLNIKLKKYTKYNIIYKIQYDTYVREIERYSYINMKLSEYYFSLDSIRIMKSINIIRRAKDENLRWQCAILLIDSTFNSFSINLDNKIKIITELDANFKAEFGFNKYNSKSFNVKYRKYKNIVENLLLNPETPDVLKRINTIVIQTSKLITPIAKQINLNFKNKEELINELLKSYIHMLCNRLFIFNQRTYELVLYDIMKRYYISLAARIVYSKTPK